MPDIDTPVILSHAKGKEIFSSYQAAMTYCQLNKIRDFELFERILVGKSSSGR